MICVQYPPTLTRNFQGKIDIVPCFFTELFIDETTENNKEILELIRDASFKILQNHKYSSIINFSVYEINDELANIHFQVPKYAIDIDKMEPDETVMSYYGTIRFGQTDGTVSDILN